MLAPRVLAPFHASILTSVAVAALLTEPARAQRGSWGPTSATLDAPQPNLLAPGSASLARGARGARPTILLTGYWPPSNEAVRRFSPSPVQNPLGWIGQDWEGRGYDVVSYFPEFNPPDCTSCGTGSGDLEVDYQDTSNDFWAIANAVQPIAIITFSRTTASLSWEAEMNQYNRQTWVNDYVNPKQPTPAPPDASVPAGYLRLSALPVQAIVDDVLDANLGLNAFICYSGSAGGFLSEFIAYHGVWYQAIHASPSDPAQCLAAGHIHVGSGIPWPTAELAAAVTLRTVIHYVDSVRFGACNDVDLYCATSTNSVGPGAMLTTTGSTSIGANDLRLIVTGAPADSNGIVFYGASPTQVPWGNGQMCVLGPRQRVPPTDVTNADGFLDRALDFTLAPFASGTSMIAPGSTWNFQFAYRDPAAGNANFNLTNAAQLSFCP